MFADFLHIKKECGADELEGVADAVCLEVNLLQQMVQDQEGALENHSDQLEKGSNVLISLHAYYYLFLANIRFSEGALTFLPLIKTDSILLISRNF
jgi:hypothetical protein